MRCRTCGCALEGESKPSSFPGVATFGWSGPDGRQSCPRGGPHTPEVKTTVTDADLERFLGGQG